MMLTRRVLVCSATLTLTGRPVAQERTRLVFATAGQGSARTEASGGTFP